MKATNQYFPVVLFIMFAVQDGCNTDLSLWMKS